MNHRHWKTLQERELAQGYSEPTHIAEVRREIRLSMALAEAIYERRTELGMTHQTLAERAGLEQTGISRIEGSDIVPSLLLLADLANALDATASITLDTDNIRVVFVGH
ncbi:helix-turn-helix domain-containing protein [Nocardia sp. NPDC004568]|uniref:helix-turn-helix domain-containing protein n=1 Tax=Nocardia sp. NPDC004568 TaxID=3154551 RepID=UPI0033A5B4D0